MGIDIYIVREARVNGEWRCCEPSEKDYHAESQYPFEDKSVRDESASDLDVGRYSQLFGILAGEAYCVSECMMNYGNGVPKDMSKPLAMRIEDEDKRQERWLTELHMIPCAGNKKNYYNCTFKDLKNYLEKWRNDMIETGYMPCDFINDEGAEKLTRFENGIYKKDLEKKMAFMLKVFDDPECNPLVWFIEELNKAKCGKDFTWNLSEIPDEDKRITFWFS